LNIILSRQSDIEAQELVVVHRNIESVLAFIRDLKSDLFVIGGSKIYQAFLPYIEKWIVTEVPLTVEGADTFVPANYLDGFHRVGSKELDEGLIVRYYERD